MSKKTPYANYKRTTDQQYRLLTREMSSGSGEGKQFWINLTESLNALGPPYRNMSQWKKVWTDFRRFHSRRNFQSQPKFKKHLKEESNIENAVDYEEYDTSQSMYNPNVARQKSPDDDEIMNFEQNSLSMHSTFSNDCSEQYSFTERKYEPYEHPSSSLQGQSVTETLIPDDDQPSFACSSYAYAETVEEPHRRKSTAARTATAVSAAATDHYPASSSNLMDQTLYTLQNQMENQTKLLEHLSQISSTMAGLMERQVTAVEKQTEAIRRQASATEHHTLVMNSFVEMIREKMPKASIVKTAASNLPNGNL